MAVEFVTLSQLSSLISKAAEKLNALNAKIHGVPVGGTTGQVLEKTSGTDYAVSWADPTGGVGGSFGTLVYRGTYDIGTEYTTGDVVNHAPVEFQDSYLFVMTGTGTGYVPSMEANSASALWVLLTAGKTAASLEAQTLMGPEENSVLLYGGGGIGWVPGFVTVDNTGWNANNAYSIGKVVRYSVGATDFWYCTSAVASSVPGNLPPDQDYVSWTAFSTASHPIPIAGGTGQVLTKNSDGDFDIIWADAPAAGLTAPQVAARMWIGV